MRAQASRHLDGLNVLLGDKQACGEYLGGLCVHLGDNGHLLHLGDEDSDKERGAWTPPPEGGDLCDDIVVVPPLTGPS